MLMMMMRMMMMNMTQMKLVNSATKFRHGMDKFYQPNSGLRSSRSLDEAIYTYILWIVYVYFTCLLYTYVYIYIYTCFLCLFSTETRIHPDPSRASKSRPRSKHRIFKTAKAVRTPPTPRPWGGGEWHKAVVNYPYWLVAWNIWIIFPYIGNFIIPTDEFIFFRGVD